MTIDKTRKYRILFVCLGNICRSPMAEAVFRQMVLDRGLEKDFDIDSAGTAAYHVGDTPDSRSVACCKKHGVPVNHRGRQVTKADFTSFTHLLCMDESNLRDLRATAPKSKDIAHVGLLGDFDPKGDRIIKDPYYGATDGFERNFHQVTRSCSAFLAHLGYEA
ncbi:MAG: phosphotyrosine protein phosphatase I superfamily [Piptocephalis tieghemiana]|nr:MAG: phosphotyrosine protein phosphatase I superfamily [Piptocephalis tieghemiana]